MPLLQQLKTHHKKGARHEVQSLEYLPALSILSSPTSGPVLPS